jgi:recombination protein U
MVAKKKTTTKKKSVSHKNRGLKFEKLIEDKCEELQEKEIALIHKVPTAWQVTRGAFGKIVNAFPIAESKFVDFVGIFKNKAIAIEAKETKEEKRFPFANIKASQIRFLNLWVKLGGLGYYIIRFETNKKVFLIDAKLMHNCIETIDRKSAPFNWFLETDGVIELDYKNLNFDEYI